LISRTTARFRSLFSALPPNIQLRARRAYRLFSADPHHPSLHFEQVHPTRPIFSVWVGLGYRALGVRTGETVIWFWIGSHADYDQLLRTLH
jgi:hypothetical protein